MKRNERSILNGTYSKIDRSSTNQVNIIQLIRQVVWCSTYPTAVQAAVGVSEQVMAFGHQSGLPPTLTNRIGLAIEEMAVNTAIHGKTKNKHAMLDIRARLTEEEVIVSLRDNGIPFDPSMAPRQDESALAYGGIEIARRIASKFEYSHHLGFNATVLVFDRPPAEGGQGITDADAQEP